MPIYQGIDKEYDKLLQAIKEFYDKDVRSGKSVSITIHANKQRVTGKEKKINEQF